MIIKDSNRRVKIEITLNAESIWDESAPIFTKEYNIISSETVWNEKHNDWECIREIDTNDAEHTARVYAIANNLMCLVEVIEEYPEVASNNAVTDVYMRRNGMSKTEAERSTQELSNDVYDSICSGASFCEIEDMLLAEGFEMDYLLDLI